MARPREVEDEVLLDAAGRALSTHGPTAFTLARAAEQAGVAAATFINRFGSKRDLFVRLSRRWVDSLDAELDAVEAACGSPLRCVRALALHNYHDLDHPERAARQLSALAVDLQDAELRGLLHEGWGKVRARLERQLAAAADAGELVGAPPPDQLARITYTAMEGGCLLWSVHPAGSLVARLSADLDALLSGWTPHPREGTP